MGERGWINLLTTWARRIERHDYIAFGPFEHSGNVGFYYCVDSAMEDAVICIAAGDAPLKGVTGMVVSVNDHGNVDPAMPTIVMVAKPASYSLRCSHVRRLHRLVADSAVRGAYRHSHREGDRHDPLPHGPLALGNQRTVNHRS